MSFYSFIASPSQLPEVNPTNVEIFTMTVREMKDKGITASRSTWPDLWDDFPDDMEIMRTIDHYDRDGFQVELCPPHYVVDNYTTLPYIHTLGGNFKDKECMKDLYRYLKEDIPEGVRIEVWSVWIGSKEPIKYRKQFKRSELTLEEVQQILDPDFCLILD